MELRRVVDAREFMGRSKKRKESQSERKREISRKPWRQRKNILSEIILRVLLI